MATTKSDEEKVRAEIAKLQAETALLGEELTHKRKWKWPPKLTALAGTFSVLIAAGTVILTSVQWRFELARERNVRADASFESAITKLSLPDARNRALGVVALRSFLSQPSDIQFFVIITAIILNFNQG